MKFFVIAAGGIAASLMLAPVAQASPCTDAQAWQRHHNESLGSVDSNSQDSVDAYNREADQIDAAITKACGYTPPLPKPQQGFVT